MKCDTNAGLSCFSGRPSLLQSAETAMAFQAGRAEIKCNRCGVKGKFFKMFQSYRPDHCYPDEEGKWMATLFCLDCELKNREQEWSFWTGKDKEIAGEDWVTMTRVKKDHKNRSKQSWAARSEPIINAKLSVKALREEWSEEVNTQVNFLKCIHTMDEEDATEDPGGSSSSQADLGVLNDGQGAPGASYDGPGASHDSPTNRQ